jgi:pimeloyl-ACP methyl ester carboxylesterase
MKTIKRNPFLVFHALVVTIRWTFHPLQGSSETGTENNTLMQTESIYTKTASATNIVLVHGAWADGSSWNKVIPILENSGHRVIAVQLSFHSHADDVATVKRAIGLVGGPITLVGHS